MHFLIPKVIVLTIWATLIGLSSGVKCWNCSSQVDSKCEDSFDGETSRTVKQIDCSNLHPSEIVRDSNHNGAPTTCIKIVSHSTETGESVVTRGCYQEGLFELLAIPESKCNTVNSPEGVKTVCICKEDYCNGGGTHWLSLSVFLVVVIPFIRIL